MSEQEPSNPSMPQHPGVNPRLHRVEHYALYLLNGMAAAGSGALSDGDIDYVIDLAEILSRKLVERGHLPPQP